MNQESTATSSKQHVLIRGLYMLLMAFVLQLCGTLLFFLAVIQFVLVLVNDTPNIRLASFGGSLANYTKQIVAYLCFASEEIPFPFSDWPSRP